MFEPSLSTYISSYETMFIESMTQEKNHFGEIYNYVEDYELILRNIYKEVYINILELLGMPYSKLIAKLIKIHTIKSGSTEKLDLHELYNLFSRGNIWELPTYEVCQYTKNCMEKCNATNIHIYNGSPDVESITLSCAIIKSGVFGKDIPSIKCFDSNPEKHKYSSYVGAEFLSAECSGVFDEEITEIKRNQLKFHEKCKYRLPDILKQPQNLIKSNITKPINKEYSKCKSLLVCTYPNDTYFGKILKCVTINNNYNGILIICDTISNMRLPTEFIDLFKQIGYTFIEYGDQPSISYHDIYDEKFAFIRTKFMNYRYNSNQLYFIKSCLIEGDITIQPRLYTFEQSLTYLMIEHINNIKIYDITYDLNLFSINNILKLVIEIYTDNRNSKNDIKLHESIFTAFFIAISSIKPFINIINYIKENSENILNIIKQLNINYENATEFFDKTVIQQQLEIYNKKLTQVDYEIFFEFNRILRSTCHRTDMLYTYKIKSDLIKLSNSTDDIINKYCNVCCNLSNKKIYCKKCYIPKCISNHYYCSLICQEIDIKYIGHNKICGDIKRKKLTKLIDELKQTK